MSSIVKNYCASLPAQLKEKYISKLVEIGNVDPYSQKWIDLNKNLDILPGITHEMMMDFLIFRVSPETQMEIRAHKSLQAYIQFACKWIRGIAYFKIEERFVIIGKVEHSQRVSESPLCPWILQSTAGEIIETHCTCVAGFSRVCTHVASILFALEYASRTVEPNQSVTDVLAYWIGPSKRKGEFSKSLAEIDFTNPKRKLESNSCDDDLTETSASEDEIPSLSRDEVVKFLKKCKEDKQRVALFGIVDGLSETECIVNPLMTLYKQEYENLPLEKLRELSGSLNITITQEECAAINQQTLKQNKSKKWFYYRSGRITASIFKSVCKTKIEKPSISLLKKICYPVTYKTVFQATEYGCKHEKQALTSYLIHHKQQHRSAKLEKTGLIIHPDFPFFGASPDSILVCSDCQYCAKDVSIQEWVEFKKTCLISRNGRLELDPSHAYYFQCQMQMALCALDICDFVIWNKKEFFVRRIEKNTQFWEENSAKAIIFMRNVVLPELLGKHFTNKISEELSADSRTDNSDNTLYQSKATQENVVAGPSKT